MSRLVLIVALAIGIVSHLGISEMTNFECGIVEYDDGKVLGGNATVRGEWPYLAALFRVSTKTFFCGGTLISETNVLTAAHCIQKKDHEEKLAAEDVKVFLGSFNISKTREKNVQQSDVEVIYIHPEWKFDDPEYDADLAVIHLFDTIDSTAYVRPICLPDVSDNVPKDATGTIVGWGLSENNLIHEDIPLQANIDVLNDNDCPKSHRARLFCGRSVDSSPGRGDSGGGFFVKSGDLWIQYGVISSVIAENRVIMRNSTSKYTNLQSFRYWIEETVLNAGKNVTKTGINLLCIYKIVRGRYTCKVGKTNVTRDNYKIESFNGAHANGFTDENVTDIYFSKGKIYSIPDGTGQKFKNLELFRINPIYKNSGLIRLRKSNFQDMEFMKELDFRFNQIGKIDEDTLTELPNLEKISVADNQLKKLQKNIFERNVKLTHVDASSNMLEILPDDLFKNNPLLQSVCFEGNILKRVLADFTHLTSISKLSFNGNECIDDSLEDAIEEDKKLDDFLTDLRMKCQ